MVGTALQQKNQPSCNFTSDAIFLMRSHIQDLSDEHGYITEKDRDKHIFYPTGDVSQDPLMVATVMTDTYDHPLPIVDPDPPIPLWATLIYPDASGNIGGATALGALFPP